MSKGIKRTLVIAIVVIALIAVSTSVAFAWWDSTKSGAVNITANNASSNFILTVNKDAAISNNAKLVPAGAFTDATHKTSICIGAFTPTVSSTSGASVAGKADLTYSIETFTVKTDQKGTGNYVITVNTSSTDATNGVAAGTGKLTAGTKYYIHISFKSGIDSATAKTFDAGAIALKIKVTATDRV